jgi:hypothetical protein
MPGKSIPPSEKTVGRLFFPLRNCYYALSGFGAKPITSPGGEET